MLPYISITDAWLYARTISIPIVKCDIYTVTFREIRRKKGY